MSLQLGDGDTSARIIPAEIPVQTDGSPIVQVASGDEHTVMLTEDGTVFGCGKGASGQLALEPGETTDGYSGASVFTRITSMRHFKVLQVSAGLAHTLLLTEAGEPFAFGSNRSGQLGRRVTPQGDSFELPDLAQCFAPQRVAGLAGTRITQVCASSCLA